MTNDGDGDATHTGGGAADADGGGLRRVLGPVDATAVVIGGIIGVGIFFTPSRVAALVDSSWLVLATWGLGGLIALLGALTFADLGRLYPHTGGQYVILRDAFGPATSFVYVLCNATAIQAGATAIIALVCAQNLAVVATGHDATPALAGISAAALIVILMIVNAVGVRQGAAVQNATVVAKLATLLAIGAAAAWFAGEPAAMTEAAAVAGPRPWTAIVAGVGAALVPVLFSFGGWQQALWMAGEVRRPRRDVPLAIIVGVLVVVGVYLLATWAYLHLLGHGRVASSTALAADAVAVVWGEAGRRGLALAVALSAFGVLNAQLLTGPRLIYAMARDGRFFAPFARLHARYCTPVPAIAMLGGVALVLLAVGGQRGLDRLLTGVVLVDGVFFALTALALPVLRRRRARAGGDASHPRPYPGYPITALLFVAAELGVIAGAYADPEVRSAAFVGVAWIIGALITYWALFRRRARAAGG